MTPKFLTELSAAAAEAWAVGAGLSAYRGRQIVEWICRRLEFDPERMTSLPLEVRRRLAAEFPLPAVEADRRETPDGVVKTALRLCDGEVIEMAVIPAEDGRRTLCLSTQVGCAVGCRFCASGADGVRRNLAAGEMIAEFLCGCRIIGSRCDNIVFMGIGEGMMNFDELAAALERFTSPEYFALSPRRITVSTSGYVPGMLRFAGLRREYNLAVSLHAPDDATRSLLIPDRCRYPIAEILAAADRCREANGRDFTLEYTLCDGINDSPAAARALGELAVRHHAKVNLIPCNAGTGEFRRPPKAAVEAFHRAVAATGARVTRRVERGSRGVAACGQLRIHTINSQENRHP